MTFFWMQLGWFPGRFISIIVHAITSFSFEVHFQLYKWGYPSSHLLGQGLNPDFGNVKSEWLVPGKERKIVTTYKYY